MTTTPTNRNEWIFNCKDFELDKNAIYNSYILYMLNRTMQIFNYKKLPDTINKRDLETILQRFGYAIVTDVKGKLYAFFGGLGNELNEYYHPTHAIVNNPYLKFNKDMVINEDCIVIKNDSNYCGLFPLFDKYAKLLTECDVSIRIATINSRIPSVLIADSDSTKASAELYLKDILDGKLGIIRSSVFDDNVGVKSEDYMNHSAINTIAQLTELSQYLKSHWFIDLGLNANYNMKRESINENESAMNDYILLPLIDDMLEQRKNAIKQINEKYGTQIEVELNSSWEILREEMKKEIEEQPKQEEGGNGNGIKETE